MANHKDALKRDRQSKKLRLKNRSNRAEMRTSLKAVREAVAEGDSQNAAEALRNAQSLLHRLAGKGVVHANKADRLIGRLTAAVKGTEAETAN